jgi:metallophosphoesterase (TIGR00282 family)
VSSRILAVGDVVGEEATAWLAKRLPALRADHAIDWIIVNAENCTVTGPSPMNGFGIGAAAVDLLSSAGVDVITGGNHSWDGEETAVALMRPTVVRPWNVDHELGRGIVTLEHAGSALTVVNLLSPSAMLPGAAAPQPRKIWPSWCELRSRRELAGAVVIDLHGESAWEKMSFAAAVDGTVTAVVGTHTHDPSLRGHILPHGTGYITEVGMTGRLGFTGGGFNPAHFAASLRGEDLSALPPFELASGPMTAGAVLITADDSHRVTHIARLQLGEDHLQFLPANGPRSGVRK